VDWESIGHLADGVGLGITLAVDSIDATVADSTVARDTSIAIVHSCYDSVAIAMVNLTNGVGIGIGLTLAVGIGQAMRDIGGVADIVGVSSGIGIVDWESIGHLADGVGLGIGISITLAIDTIDATVADSTVARDKAMAVVHSGDNSIAIAMVNLADGVGIGIGIDSDCS